MTCRLVGGVCHWRDCSVTCRLVGGVCHWRLCSVTCRLVGGVCHWATPNRFHVSRIRRVRFFQFARKKVGALLRMCTSTNLRRRDVRKKINDIHGDFKYIYFQVQPYNRKYRSIGHRVWSMSLNFLTEL